MNSSTPAAPFRKCDIVMKGGITSGIVYPGLICKLANHYRFQSIGGTSAGAIAAALTAAAEHARGNGREMFGEVAKVPGWLGAKCSTLPGSNLLNLFQPQNGMRGLFHIATAFLVKGWPARIGRCARALWLEILLGLFPLCLFAYFSPVSHGWRAAVSILLGLFLLLTGIALASTLGLLIRLRRLSSHHYGLCTGWTASGKNRPASLVTWLDERLNTISGISAGRPLTFGDLKGSGIVLKMISTCLTFGRPFTIPFETSEFYFCPSEMRRYFPDEVVAWMENHPAEIKPHSEPVDVGALKPLPNQDELPVIVATRLSLSFPFLFCAVPLYAVDWSRRRRKAGEPIPAKRVPGDAIGPEELRKPERIWFSDGGICSNFPLHLFDHPFPKWPTFAIDLDDLRPDRPDRVWMPQTNSAGIAYLWKHLTTKPAFGSAAGLFSVMFGTARNWMDNLQSIVPGYRDRVVHVFLDNDEGGLNLNMPAQILSDLSHYGELAGQKLIDHFIQGVDGGEPTMMTWDNQRWVRYRSAMALLESFLAELADSVANQEPGDKTYYQLINRGADDPPKSYRFTEVQKEEARVMTKELEDVGRQGEKLENGAPRPKAALRVTPSF